MPDNPSRNNMTTVRNPLIIGGFIFAVFAILAYWGGLPLPSEIPKFILGILVLMVIGGGISILGWVLLFQPVPYVVVRYSPLTALQRQIIGLVLIVTAALESLGGIWDEAWHLRYGIPFGKDFFWRPHILIYSSLLSIIIAASIGWIALVLRGKGTWIQRFRGDPALGMVIVTGMFLFLAVPADPIWHSIYGTDLSAFSIPHVLLTILLMASLLSGVALLLTSDTTHSWRSIFRVKPQYLLPLVAIAFLLQAPVTLLTVDWYGLKPSDLLLPNNLVFQLPAWLLPVFILFMASLVGTLATRALRYFGVATMVGVLALVIRFGLANAVNSPTSDASLWLLLLPPMIAIDLVYIIQLNRNRSSPWWLIGLTVSVSNIFVLPLINTFLRYPNVTLNNLPGMLLFPTLGGLMGAWIGTIIGDYLAVQSIFSVTSQQEKPTMARWIMPVLVGGVLIFAAWFVASAVPPIWAS